MRQPWVRCAGRSEVNTYNKENWADDRALGHAARHRQCHVSASHSLAPVAQVAGEPADVGDAVPWQLGEEGVVIDAVERL